MEFHLPQISYLFLSYDGNADVPFDKNRTSFAKTYTQLKNIKVIMMQHQRTMRHISYFLQHVNHTAYSEYTYMPLALSGFNFHSLFWLFFFSFTDLDEVKTQIHCRQFSFSFILNCDDAGSKNKRNGSDASRLPRAKHTANSRPISHPEQQRQLV